MEKFSHDLLIVGGGAAGLRAAIAAAESSRALDIAIVSKVYPMRSHTVSAEGGSAAVLREYDSFDSHGFDTVRGSDFLADQDAVEGFVREAPNEIIQLEHWGCPWSRDPDGRISVRAFGGMSVKRTVYAADKTGFHLLHTLFQTSLKYDNIERYDESFATSIIVSDGRCLGVTAIDLHTGDMIAVAAKATILATGGAGRVYEFTTNGFIKTGDGMSMAYRAGTALKDMEFVQYHPTALPGTGILVTEAARGEGGYLVNRDGERFLKRYIPEKMELGPRDILSRAIITEIHEGRGVEGPYGQHVYLDLRHLGKETIEKKLPFVEELAKEYIGIDPVSDLIPVRPGVHYFMGGIHTDSYGRTELPGLYAAGEVACVSINGANRLGSNSLSECLVFGARAGKQAAMQALSEKDDPDPPQEIFAQEESRIFDRLLKREVGEVRFSELRTKLQLSMENGLGIFRKEDEIVETCRTVSEIRSKMDKAALDDHETVFNTELTSALELEFMLDVAETIAWSALRRLESRGAHSRLEYPNRDDSKFLAHTSAYKAQHSPRITYLPVKITRWPPAARKY